MTMTTSSSAPLVGRRPRLAGGYEVADLCGAWRKPAQRATLSADRRTARFMVAEQLDTDTDVVDDGLDDTGLDFTAEQEWDPESMLDAAEMDAIGILPGETFAEFAARLSADDLGTDEGRDIATNAAGWGDVFDPADLQWGFSVRTRF